MQIEDKTSGKYYSTYLVVTLPNGMEVDITLSCLDDREPSYWELERNYEGSLDIFAEDCTNGHYERASTRLVADTLLSIFGDSGTDDVVEYWT